MLFQKLNEIISNVHSSIQTVLDATLSLFFQPLYILIAVLQQIYNIWTTPDETEEQEPQPQQTVTTYPSVNEGRYAEECELPACEKESHIGFKINKTEQDEITKLKKELNK